MPINEKLRIAFEKSFAVNTNFTFHQRVQIASNELQDDGVHLNEAGEKKLHDMLEDCLRSGWIARLVDHG
jgi:lysophospholipase L1-like esterase